MAILVSKQKIVNRIFAERYIKNEFNGQKTVQELKPHLQERSANVEAARRLADASQQKAIVEIMEEQGLTDDIATKIHKENLVQRENLPASNSALEMYHKLKGRLKNETTNTHLHLHADISEVQDKLKALDAELLELEH